MTACSESTLWEQLWLSSQQALPALGFPSGCAQGCGETAEPSSILSQPVSWGRQGRLVPLWGPRVSPWVRALPCTHSGGALGAQESPQTQDMACGLPGWVCSVGPGSVPLPELWLSPTQSTGICHFQARIPHKPVRNKGRKQ